MDLESLFRIERTIDPHLRVIDFDLLLLSSGIFKVFRYFSNSRCCEGAMKQRKLHTQIFVNISHATCNGLEFFKCELWCDISSKQENGLSFIFNFDV